MKKILGTVFLICSVFILSFAQHEEEQHMPKDTTVLDAVTSDDSTKNEILNQLDWCWMSDESLLMICCRSGCGD